MAASIAFRCDICGTSKRETNHWWLIFTGDEKSVSAQHELHNLLPERRFLVVPWQAELASRPGVHHACGQLCMQRAVERFMSDEEIFPEIGSAAAQGPEENPFAGLLAQPEGIEPMDLDTLVNSVAESVVQSAMTTPLVAEQDEAGELSAVLGPAQPRATRRR